MGLNDVASAERVHIAFFGVRNAGKSSLINAVTGQSLSIVSDVKGTTTDPVSKAMELLPLGPVVIIDTPGIDDEGDLGELRVKKTHQVLGKTDIAVIVSDFNSEETEYEKLIKTKLNERKIPYLIAHNKCDIADNVPVNNGNDVYVSALKGVGIFELKEKLGEFAKSLKTDKKIIADLIEKGDTVLLVIPVDESAPKGRLILPQQQTMREILDSNCSVIACQPEEVEGVLALMNKPPKLVVTDSQAFGFVSKVVPETITLTSFSILFARYKGNLEPLVRGAAKLKALKDGDKVLISEGCTHHRQCNDIGTVKMPNWIENFSGSKLEFSFSSGGDFPDNLNDFALVVHCGGCMLNEKEMQSRILRVENAGVPIVNYGIAIAHMHNILPRSLEVFPYIKSIIE